MTNHWEHDLECLANERNGDWEGWLYETLSGSEKWLLALQGPNVLLEVALDNPNLLVSIQHILGDEIVDHTAAELVLSTDDNHSAVFIPGPEPEQCSFSIRNSEYPVFILWFADRNLLCLRHVIGAITGQISK